MSETGIELSEERKYIEIPGHGNAGNQSPNASGNTRSPPCSQST